MKTYDLILFTNTIPEATYQYLQLWKRFHQETFHAMASTQQDNFFQENHLLHPNNLLVARCFSQNRVLRCRCAHANNFSDNPLAYVGDVAWKEKRVSSRGRVRLLSSQRALRTVFVSIYKTTGFRSRMQPLRKLTRMLGTCVAFSSNCLRYSKLRETEGFCTLYLSDRAFGEFGNCKKSSERLQ